MDRLPPNTSPEAFLQDVFKSRLVRDGKVIRRASRDVERYIGREAFIAEVYRRGFCAIENAGQIIIFCNQEPVRILRPRAPL
ncbi:N-(5'-phosphoribosyl)anthranilate isomerase [Roseicyclus marinus]|uniref:N-(5'-phosphoribosyl)anthranilate isomerase n=1 Tax=Roseicyclus marinus TaxID=2161673 RepID=UPI00240FB53B|nr:N-(5'-phosphoribosyl)anthranilate isomerase [Roseicyclus marinus]MDG3040002.1 N-(5'-phosphoribosyl)anthranilate isomerase [Roseicyclus marinus]